MRPKKILLITVFFLTACQSFSQPILIKGQPVELTIRKAGEHSIRVTLKPVSYKGDFPSSPVLATGFKTSPAAISISTIQAVIKRKAGAFTITITPDPLAMLVVNANGQEVQHIVFEADGNVSFNTGNAPILGMGEGGPKPIPGINWRDAPIQFDRRGVMDSMQPRWQSDAYGSRNPVALLVGTEGWALFAVTPWVSIDLRDKDRGKMIPWVPRDTSTAPQTEKNQQLNGSKGLPPIDKIIPGLFDFFVFDAHEPTAFMQDFSAITGPAAMPPKWALGYMQSHRTLQDENQLTGIVDTFRNRRIPLDAVIYLGTGFTPVGWNTQQPSFEPNPKVFKRDFADFLSDMHQRHAKVVLHMVPWDRNRLPSLHGSIPAAQGEILDEGHIKNYWQQHLNLVRKGVDAFWPDEGDWFNLFERIKRHQLYYQGYLSSKPNIRPWSLQRNGFPGIAQWGGWVWSGDTESSWKTLEGQVAVGINYSLSTGPYWGSDIGGFYSNTETTGELYARWFQFGAFCGSFRSHGRTWHTRLPWGWGSNDLGTIEDRVAPLTAELNNPAIEPIIKKYDELRYQLFPYTYTLAWEARNKGLPLMRAMWLHYPNDNKAKGMGTQYLWGRDILIAPVFEKAATKRSVYLPAGDWYDWWTHEKIAGRQTISRPVDLSVMPMYIRAGSIIPTDAVRQYTDEAVASPTTLTIFSGIDGDDTLYDDDGISQDYIQGKGQLINMKWNDKTKTLTLAPGNTKAGTDKNVTRKFTIRIVPGNQAKELLYAGKATVAHFE